MAQFCPFCSGKHIFYFLNENIYLRCRTYSAIQQVYTSGDIISFVVLFHFFPVFGSYIKISQLICGVRELHETVEGGGLAGS